MGRQKLRFDVRKNHEQRKKLCRAVACISAIPTELFVRLPIATTYLPSRVSSVKTLHERLRKLDKLSSGWTTSLHANNFP